VTEDDEWTVVIKGKKGS